MGFEPTLNIDKRPVFRSRLTLRCCLYWRINGQYNSGRIRTYISTLVRVPSYAAVYTDQVRDTGLEPVTSDLEDRHATSYIYLAIADAGVEPDCTGL